MKKSELKQLIKKIITEIESHNYHPAGYSQKELDNADFSDDAPNWKKGGVHKTHTDISHEPDQTDTGVDFDKPKHDLDEVEKYDDYQSNTELQATVKFKGREEAFPIKDMTHTNILRWIISQFGKNVLKKYPNEIVTVWVSAKDHSEWPLSELCDWVRIEAQGRTGHKVDKLQEIKGLSGFKETSSPEDNTQMGKDDKSITSTDKPVEKEEGKKLPVKDSTKNTNTDHFVGKMDTATLPIGEKKEKVRPVGGTASTKDGGMKSNGLKEDILSMIHEALEKHRVKKNLSESAVIDEMAKTPIKLVNGVVTGGVNVKFRKQDPKSPTGWSMIGHPQYKDGTPVEAPKLTGKNYIPKNKSTSSTGNESIGLEVSVQNVNGKIEPLEFDFLNNAWPASKKFIESEVMSTLGDASVDPNVKIGQEVYDVIETAKEADLDGQLTPANNRIILYFDPKTKQLRAKK